MSGNVWLSIGWAIVLVWLSAIGLAILGLFVDLGLLWPAAIAFALSASLGAIPVLREFIRYGWRAGL